MPTTVSVGAASGVASNSAVKVPLWDVNERFCQLPPAAAVTHVGPAEIVKSQTVVEPGDEEFTKVAQLFRLAPVLCSVLKAKLAPTVCSDPPSGVTKIE